MLPVKKGPGGLSHQIARRVPSFVSLCAQPLAGGALQQLQHVLVGVAGAG